LNEAALVARRISERQHIDNLKNSWKNCLSQFDMKSTLESYKQAYIYNLRVHL
jgi:hypothetical protein